MYLGFLESQIVYFFHSIVKILEFEGYTQLMHCLWNTPIFKIFTFYHTVFVQLSLNELLVDTLVPFENSAISNLF